MSVNKQLPPEEIRACAAGLRDGMGGHADYCADIMELLAQNIAAAEQAQQAKFCVACEGRPSAENSPCAVCGAQQAEPAARDVLMAFGVDVLVKSGSSMRECDLAAIVDRYASQPPYVAVPDSCAKGIEAVAKMLEKKAEDYAAQYGYDDGCGGISFGRGHGGESKNDYYNGLLELAEEVRAMLAAAQKGDK